jgi:spermidine/putrescine-binding protein
MLLNIPEPDSCDESPAPHPQDDQTARQNNGWFASARSAVNSWRKQLLISALRKTIFVAFLLLTLVATVALFGRGSTTPVLKIYVWAGYAEAAVIAQFESKCNCYVSVHYMNTSDDLFSALEKGDEYDVISPSSDIAGDLVSAGLVRELNKDLIPSHTVLKSPLDTPALTRPEDDYGVPFIWGPNVLIYNTDVFPSAPDSWNILLEERYRGRVAVWDDLSSLYMAGLLQNPQAEIYNVNDARTACRWLQVLPRKGIRLWEEEPDLVTMFKTGQVVAAMGWPLAARDLQSLGMPIKTTIPREKTTGWVDYLMIPRSSRHADLAYKLIEYLSEIDQQKSVARVTHTYPANTNAFQDLKDKDEMQMWTTNGNIKFWQALGENRTKYLSAWDGWKRSNCPQ